MKIRNLFIASFFALLLSFPLSGNAQVLEDAVRFSQLNMTSSARSMGAGNTFGTIGADFSNMATNPAGLALFRKSEFYIAPQLQIVNAESRLVGENNELFTEERSRFNFTGIGYIAASERMGDWRTVNFGIGYNRLADYHRNTFYSGTGNGSIGSFFVEQADGFGENELGAFLAGPAFDAGIIFPDGSGQNFYLNDLSQAAEVQRLQSIRNSGQYGELDFTFAGNYQDRLMIGATLGVPILRFNSTNTYTEREPEGTDYAIYDEINFEQRVRMSGEGVNAKLGAIFRVNQMLRLSASYHSPSLLRIEDSYSTIATYAADFDGSGVQTFSGESPQGLFEYRLRTPARLSGGFGFIFGSNGLITAEAEVINYAGANYNFIDESAADAEYERELNQDIDNTLKRAVNLKFGGELALDIFRLRAGYGMYGSPFSGVSEFNNMFSFGAGLRERSFYLDLAYQAFEESDLLVPFLLSDAELRPQVRERFLTSRLVATVGFRF